MNPSTQSSSGKILIVDDEEIVLVALRDTLRQMGHPVVTALTVAEGLDLLGRESFAIVFTDYQMPQLTGLEFLARVRELQPAASRILITAVLNLGTVINAINRAEVLRFLVKPWRREDLEETVTAAMQRHAGHVVNARELQALREIIASQQERIDWLEAENRRLKAR